MFMASAFNKKLYWNYVLLGLVCSLLGVLMFIYIHVSEKGYFPSPLHRLEEILWAILFTNLAGVAVLNGENWLDKKINWRSHFLLRFVIGLVVNSLVAGSIIVTSGLYVIKYNANEIAKLGVLVLVALFIYEIFYGWFYSYRYYAIKQVEQLKSDRLQLELQFESLKNQISPHYLFNCLNTVSSLIYKDSHLAEEFIRRMADSFRYVLDNQKSKLVTVREEVEFVKSYYFLLQVRYENQLTLEINLPRVVLETAIPPLTLQMLVENAVKHNHISKDNPLFIYISARDNTHILVSSTKTIQQKNVPGLQVGMGNIKNRYGFYSSEAILVRDEERYTVQLPVIRQNPKLNDALMIQPAAAI